VSLAMNMHGMLESAGCLPVEGGIMDQTQAWLMSMQVIGSEQAKHRETQWAMTQSSK
jgi:hypothetical protein